MILTSCTTNQDNPDNSEATISIKETNEVQQGPITIIVDNKSEQALEYGQEFRLEKEGETIEIRDNIAWTLELYTVEPHQKGEITHDLGFLYEPLEPGEYTLIYPVFVEDDKAELKADFTILEKDHSYMEAVVIDEQELLLFDKENVGLLFLSKSDDLGRILNGDIIGIEYDMVMESFPAQVNPISAKKLVHDPNLINLGLYLIEHYQEQDPQLFNSVKEITLEITGLDEQEKEVLRYQLQNQTGMDVFFSTQQELEEAGKIKDTTYVNGAHIKLNLKEIDASTSEYTIEYFVSGNGAFAMKGTAIEGNGEYILEDHMLWVS